MSYGAKSSSRYWVRATLVALALWFTNPGREAYLDYAFEHHAQQIVEECRAHGPWAAWVCSGLVTLPGLSGPVKDFVDEHTTESNYLLFSVYTTHVHGLDLQFRSVGVLHMFFTFESHPRG